MKEDKKGFLLLHSRTAPPLSVCVSAGRNYTSAYSTKPSIAEVSP